MKRNKYSNIKFTLTFILLLQSSISFSQSKKEQIEILNIRVDSLSKLIASERIINEEKSKETIELNTKLSGLDQNIKILKNELSKLNSDLEKSYTDSKSLNQQLLNNQKIIIELQNQLTLKTDSLNTLKINLENYNRIDNIKNNNILVPKVPISTIKIGQQEWMSEDINTTTYNNGDLINEAKSEELWRDYSNKRLGCYRKLSNGTYIYNGFAVYDQRGIVPSGFAIPTYIQFNKLITILGGGDSKEGKATKSLATYSIYMEDFVGDQETGGLEPVEIKTNGNSGFKAKEGGFVYNHGAIGNEGSCSYWWTSTSEGQDKIIVDIGYCSQDLGGGKGVYPATFGFAVRAIKK
jgi:uncharacterized protein (TIGR02145 family)